MVLKSKSLSKEGYEELCVKAIAGRLGPLERQSLENWLSQSEGNRAYYEHCKQVWQQTDWSVPPEIPDAQNAWLRLARSLSISLKKKKRLKQSSISHWMQPFVPSFHNRLRLVLVSVVFVSVVTIGLIQFVFNAHPVRKVITQSAEKSIVQLPDGSKVWLNSESCLQYAKKFTEPEREIHLKGEAYFTVVQNDKPFVVYTENACTRVLGTTFNVWSRHQKTCVIVEKGRVELMRSLQDSFKVDLVSNEMSRINHQQCAENPQSVNAEFRIGWMEGRLVFEKASLSEILEEIGRFYGVKIYLHNEALARETVTATFDNTSLSSVLESLSLSCNTEYQYRSEDQIDFGLRTQEAS
jgi:transmembrane sensor